MSWFLSLMCFMSGASLYHSLIVLETYQTRAVVLSTVGIDVSKMKSLSFKLTTCSHSVVFLEDDDSQKFSVFFNYKHAGKPYLGIRCEGNDCVKDLVYKPSHFSYCLASVAFWISWDKREIVMGEGLEIGLHAMTSYPLKGIIVSGSVWSNASKPFDTWEFDIDAPEESESAASTEISESGSVSSESTSPSGQLESGTDASERTVSTEHSESGTETAASNGHSKSGTETVAFVGQSDSGTETSASIGQSESGTDESESTVTSEQLEPEAKKNVTFEEATNERSLAPSSFSNLASVKVGLLYLFFVSIYLSV